MRKLLFALVVGVAAWITPALQAQAPVAAPQPVAVQPAAGTVPTPIPPPAGAPLPTLPGPGCGSTGSCCEQPCCIKTKKVCVPEPSIRKIENVIYCGQTKDFCSPGCALCGHGCHSGCSTCSSCGSCGGHGLCNSCPTCPPVPECGHPCHKRVLMKKVCVTECPSVTCHVEEQVVMPTCQTCAPKCTSGCCTTGCCSGASTVPVGNMIPSAPMPANVPMMPPATTAVTPASSVAVPQPMPVTTPAPTAPAVPVIHN